MAEHEPEASYQILVSFVAVMEWGPTSLLQLQHHHDVNNKSSPMIMGSIHAWYPDSSGGFFRSELCVCVLWRNQDSGVPLRMIIIEGDLTRVHGSLGSRPWMFVSGTSCGSLS